MPSAWQEYKNKLGTTRPWDLLDSSVPRASDEQSDERLNTCNHCTEYIKVTKQCKQCGCFMPLKTKLLESVCPLGKW
jgi:hypothetical protein